MKEYVVNRRFEVVHVCLVKADSIDEAKQKAEDDIDTDIMTDIEGDYEVTSSDYRDIHEYRGKE